MSGKNGQQLAIQLEDSKKGPTRAAEAFEPLLDTEEAAKLLRIHPKTFAETRAEERFLPPKLAAYGDSGLPCSTNGWKDSQEDCQIVAV